MSDHLGRLEAVLDVNRQAGGVAVPRDALAALCAECRRLRADVDFYQAVFAKDVSSDPGQFNAGWGAGAARQLAECVNAACVGCREGWRRKDLGWAAYHVTPQAGRQECLSYKLLRLGPVRPPLPMDRLAADNARLREALAGLLGAFRVEGDGRMVIHNGFGLPARVAAARAALGGSP